MKKIGIIMGSDSDLPVMKAAAEFLDEIGLSYELTVVSAHRTPGRLYEYSESAVQRGIGVIIAGAGGAAHLPGMVAAITPLPVIGVPVKSSKLSGQDSLYSIVQMPPGVPVATVAIDGAKNAGILAAQILGVHDPEILKKVSAYKNGLKNMVTEKAKRLEQMGYRDYLEANDRS
jgi:5-(carboxyamino)imidazole ribonucleotide mutase